MKSKTMKIQFVVLCMDRDFLFFFHYITTVAKNCFSLICVYFFFTIFQLDYERKGLVCGSKSMVASKQTQEVRESESNSISIVINYVYVDSLKKYMYL